jgi:GNAT superfamily N-acetyltransferase
MELNSTVSISPEKEKVDIEFVYDFLSKEAYWSKGIPLETVKRSIANSQNFSVFFEGRQVAYARVITDYATIAYLGDVFVTPEYRGRGISKKLMEFIMTYPSFIGLRRWILITGDAHGLYEQFGWTALNDHSKWMELHSANPYGHSI